MEDFWLYFSLGWDHIMNFGALDHILFILALTAIYILSDWKQVLILITAFTIGHSLTLALSTFHIIRIPVLWVEFLIPCTILVTSFSNLFIKLGNGKQINLNYAFALIFGLIHGLGFASGLQSLLSKNESILVPLLGFNLGLEVGQIIIVLIILLISGFIISKLKMSRKKWIIFLSLGVFSLALKMALERFPGH